MSSSNEVAIRYIEEATYGTTPVGGTWEMARVVSDSLTATPDVIVSEESRSDRMDVDQIQVSQTIGGGIAGELSYGTWDAFIEAAMCDEWATGTADELKIGTNDKSFSIEKEFGDHTTVPFHGYTGMRVNTMNLQVDFGSIANIDFGFAGNGSTFGPTSAVGGGTTNPATTTRVLNASSNFGTILIDGVAATQCITSLNLNLDNSMNPINCIGSISATDQQKYGAKINGSFNMYYDTASQAIYSKVLANTDFAISFDATDGVNTYTFNVPRARLSGEAPNKGGKDQDVMLNLNFTGLVDTVTTNSALVITRA